MSSDFLADLATLTDEKVACSSCIAVKEFDLFMPIRCVFTFETLDLVVEVTDEDEVVLRTIPCDKAYNLDDSRRFCVLKHDLGYLSEFWTFENIQGYRDGFQFEFTSAAGEIARVQAIAIASMLEILVFDLEHSSRPYFAKKGKWKNLY